MMHNCCWPFVVWVTSVLLALAGGCRMRSGPGQRDIRAGAGIAQLALDIQRVCGVSDQPIPEQAEKVGTWLKQCGEGVVRPGDYYRIVEGQVIDAYGRPIAFQWVRDRLLQLQSFGSNGRDDGGKGDDITCILEPRLYGNIRGRYPWGPMTFYGRSAGD